MLLIETNLHEAVVVTLFGCAVVYENTDQVVVVVIGRLT
jgi:hypothetical protein